MCGIAGIYDYKGKRAVDQSLLRRMADVLHHRGPDDEGIFLRKNVGLAHKRLSIIDLEGGRQPMLNEDGSLCLVFNGEIYNFRELRDELIKKGYEFKTESDTEVILRLYQEEGKDCLQKLNGMFAFAIWDDRNQTLFLARDRLGIKPLHYALQDGKLLFGSEIKAILQDASVERKLDREALHDYLTLMYVPAPKTMFEGIRKLPAGHYMLCTPDGVKIKEYWDVQFVDQNVRDEEEIQSEIVSRLRTSVRSRMISDVPLGAFLSGGVDSSSIVSLMSELSDAPVVTNSIGFSEKSHDELKYARLVADRFRTHHHEYTVNPEALQLLDRLVDLYDEPFGDASAIPTFYVSQMTRQNVKVALSGDGGDETFAGYRRYLHSCRMAAVQNAIPPFIKSGSRALASQLAGAGWNPWRAKVKNKLDELYLSPFDLYFKMNGMFGEQEKHLLYSSQMKAGLEGYSTRDSFYKVFNRCESNDYLSKIQYLDIKTYLCDDILVKVDRASMAHSLEVRVPFLDHTLVEYVASTPASLKMKNGSPKYLLKEAMAAKLSEETRNRSKMGFEIPIESWMKSVMKREVEAELFDRGGIITELFDSNHVKRLWSFVLEGRMGGFSKTDFSYRIWLLFLFSRWFKRHISNR